MRPSIKQESKKNNKLREKTEMTLWGGIRHWLTGAADELGHLHSPQANHVRLPGMACLS